MRKLLLFVIVALLFVSFAAANNQSGHPGYLWYDDLSDCSSMETCNSYTQSLGVTKFVDSWNGRKWFSLPNGAYLASINNWADGHADSTGAGGTVQFSMRYLTVSNGSTTAVMGGLYRSYTNRGSYFAYAWIYTATPFLRLQVNNGGDRNTNRDGSVTALKVYDVCLTVGNKSENIGGTNYYASATWNQSNGTMTAYSTYSIPLDYGGDDIDTLMWSISGAAGGMVSFPRVWKGACDEEPANPVTAPTVTLSYPTNKTHYNNNWNKTIIITTDIASDCTLNHTSWTITRENGTVFNFDRATTPADGNYSIQVRCNSSTYWRNTTFFVIVDSTKPYLMWNRFRGNDLNMSGFNQSVFISYNFSDRYLYRTNLTIYRNDTGAIVVRNTSYYWGGWYDWGMRQLNLTVFNTVSYINNVWHKIIIEAVDSHTASVVPEFDNAPITIDTKNAITNTMVHDLKYGDFKLSYPKDISVTPVREEDKISYVLSTAKLGATYQIIEADNLDFIENSEFPCHFIVNLNGMNGYAYDCVGLTHPVVTEITKGKKYRIDFDMDKTEVKEESLVGLNYISRVIYIKYDTTVPTMIDYSTVTTSQSITVFFNSSEAVNYTVNISEIGGVYFSSATYPSMNNLTKNFTFSGLQPNTNYSIIVRLYDVAFNPKVVTLADISTDDAPILKRDIRISKSNSGSTYTILGYLNYSSSSLLNIHYQWKWFLNGSLFSQHLYNRPINWTRGITNGSCDMWGGWLPSVCQTDIDYPINISKAYDNNSATFAFFNETTLTNRFAYIDLSYTNNSYNETPQSVNITITAKLSRRPGQSWGFDHPYGFIGLSETDYSGGNCRYTTLYPPDTGVAENSTFKFSIFVDNPACMPTGNQNTNLRIWWMQGRLFLYEISSVVYGYEKNYTQSVLSNVGNITGALNSLRGEWVLSAMAYQNTSTGNYGTYWENSSIFYVPMRSNLTLHVFDEHNFLPITENVTFAISSSYLNLNASTTNGSLYLYDIIPGDIEIRYQANNYFPRIYYLMLDEEINTSVNLYLLNNTDAGNSYIIHSVYDETADAAPNITVIMMRLYGANYVTVGMTKTNFEGEAVLSAELYDVWYKLMYKDKDGRILKITDPSPFTRTDPTISINMAEDIYWSWKNFDNVVYNLSFVNSSGTTFFRFIFSDSNNILRTACLNVQLVSATRLRTTCNNCTSTSSGILTCVVNANVTGTYKASAIIDTNSTGSYYTLDSLWWDKSSVPQLGIGGVFMAVMLVGSLGMMGLVTATGSIVMLILGIVAVSMMAFVAGFNLGFLWIIIILGMIVLFIARRGSSG